MFRFRHTTGVVRRRAQLLLDLAAFLAAFPVALLARYDFDLGLRGETYWWRGLLIILPIAAVLQIVGGRGWGLYTGRWTYGSFEELAALVATSVSVTVALIPISLLATERRLFPLGAVVGGGLLGLMLMAGTRYVWRAIREYLTRRRGSGGRRVLVAGAGAAGALIVKEMRRYPAFGLVPVGFVDDDPSKWNSRPSGVRVLGTTGQLGQIAAAVEADALLIAMPSADTPTIQRLIDLAVAAGLHTKIVPHVLTFVDGTVELTNVRDVQIEDLLGREPVHTDTAAIAHYLSQQTILVTGAGGSIGEELCRQVQNLNPLQVVLMDHDETNLHRLELSLKGRALLQSPALVVADIRDKERIRQVFRQWKPDVVFHAAAHKHLPLLEMHPSEGVKTNVEGTLHLAEAAIEHGAKRFIFVSTDKAAEPTSVLGATKRVGEMLVQHLSLDSTTCFAAVRFGNVLGSRGSVLSVFEQQIATGGPITVTHPDVTRYFMTIEEACQLVIQAGAMAGGGEIFVLDMGEPVRIADMARRMAKLSRPDEDIEIRFMGLRPGEKLHEDLFHVLEDRRRSSHPKIFVTHSPEAKDLSFWDQTRALMDAARRNDDDEVRGLLSALVIGYRPVPAGQAAMGELYPDGF